MWGVWISVILFLIMSTIIIPQLHHINNKCNFYSFAEEVQSKLDKGYTIGCPECEGMLCGGSVSKILRCISINQMEVFEKYKVREISKFNCKLSNIISNSFDTVTYTFNLEEIDMIGGFFEILSSIIIGFLFGWSIHSLIRIIHN